MGLLGANPRLRRIALRTLLDSQLAPNVLCWVPFEDHTLYVDPRDDKIALKLLAGRPWQRRELEEAIRTVRDAGRLRRDGIFLDVGANIGSQTVYAMLSGAFAQAIAVEPDPHNFAILERNLAVNGLERRVRSIQAAASAASGRLQLNRHGENHGAHSVELGFVPSPTSAIDVEAISLDDLIYRLGLDPSDVGLVKIDVEGHELAVLEGMAEFRRVKVPLLIEVTADPHRPSRIETLKALLAPHYSRVIDLEDSELRLSDLSTSKALALREQSDLLVL